MHQQPQGTAAVGIDQAQQGGTFFIELPGALGFEPEQLSNSERRFAAAKILGRDPITRQIFFGKVQAPELVILVHVADDVRQLERQSQFVSQVQCARIVEAKNMRARQSDSTGHAIAILAQPLERRVGPHGQIHLRSTDQIMQMARGHFVPHHRVHQCGQDLRRTIQGRSRRGQSARTVKDLRLPGDRLIESGAPSCQTALFRGEVLTFIGNVIHEAHKRIQGRQRIPLRSRKEKKGMVEIAMRGARHAVTFCVGIRNGSAQLGRSIPVGSGQVLGPYDGRCSRNLV